MNLSNWYFQGKSVEDLKRIIELLESVLNSGKSQPADLSRPHTIQFFHPSEIKGHEVQANGFNLGQSQAYQEQLTKYPGLEENVNVTNPAVLEKL